jgi:hypothetical protein
MSTARADVAETQANHAAAIAGPTKEKRAIADARLAPQRDATAFEPGMTRVDRSLSAYAQRASGPAKGEPRRNQIKRLESCERLSAPSP